MLSEGRSELGCLHDRAGKGEYGLWLRARITSFLAQLGGAGEEELSLNVRGMYVFREACPPGQIIGNPSGVSGSVLLGYIWVLESGLCLCCYLPKCPAGKLVAEGASAKEDMFPSLCARIEGRHCHCPSTRLSAASTHFPPLPVSPPPFILQNLHLITGWD